MGKRYYGIQVKRTDGRIERMRIEGRLCLYALEEDAQKRVDAIRRLKTSQYVTATVVPIDIE